MENKKNPFKNKKSSVKHFEEESTIIPGAQEEKTREYSQPLTLLHDPSTDEEPTVIPGDTNAPVTMETYEEELENTEPLNEVNEDIEEETFILPNEDDTNTNITQTTNPYNKKDFSYKRVSIIAGFLIVLLVSLAIALKIYNNNKQKLLLLEKQKQELKLKEKINEQFFLGINEYKLKKWKSASKYFDKALQLKPDFSKAMEYQKLISKELNNERFYNNSKSLMKNKKYDEALKELKKIDSESVYKDDAEKLKSEIEQLIIKEKEEEEKKKIEEELQKEVEEAEKEDIEETPVAKPVRKPRRRYIKRRKTSAKTKTVQKKVSQATLEKAQSIYISAYQNEVKYPKKALRAYKKIIKALPPNEPLYIKAKKRYDKLKKSLQKQ